MALTGDPIDAATAAEWGLVNRVVPDDELDDAVADLMRRATRGSARSKALGKRAFYRQIDLAQDAAYEYAGQVMAAAATTADAQEGIAAFLGSARAKLAAVSAFQAASRQHAADSRQATARYAAASCGCARASADGGCAACVA